jgi:ADP-heptose:LPS heptosyltransferase
VIDSSGTSLDELKAVIARMDVFIAVDSGPIYIAYAFDVPTVDIIGAVDENEQPPLSSSNLQVIAPNRGRPQLRVMDARSYDTKEARRQIDEITVEMAFQVLERLIDMIR